MKIKVHWIIDGVAEVEAENISSAENRINEMLSEILKDNKLFVEELGAKSIQGKGYFPWNDDK